ncbi:MAG: YggT family protein [Mycobacteriaceae bacterium]
MIVLYYVLQFFWLLLMARIIIELVTSFARQWRPQGVLVVIFEFVFTVTDPPVKLIRRLVPPISLGQVRLDISIMILMLLVFVGLSVTGSFAN